jgi:hypothetical protein
MEKSCCWKNSNYFLPRPTNQRISPTTATTSRIPTQTPALNIPPITSQELSVIAIAIAQSHNKEYCFMCLPFGDRYAKALPGFAHSARLLFEPRRRQGAKVREERKER